MNAPEVPAEARRALAALASPAWIIDLDRGRLVCANEAGRVLFGLTLAEATWGRPLDRAMPALSTLAALPLAAPTAPRRERLVFWSGEGPRDIDCEVTRLAPPDGGLVLVARCTEAVEHDGPAAASSAPCGRDKPDGEPSTNRPRDDAETLREIAHRIREGAELRAKARSRSGTSAQPIGQEPPRQAGTAPPENAAPPTRPTAPKPAAPTRPPYISKLAHELKTPLSAIAAAAALMKEEEFGPIGNERYRGYVRDIYESARHALGVINGMLGQAQQQSPDKEAPRVLEFAQIDLNAIVDTTLSPLEPLAERAGVTLSRALAPRLPNLIADATSIRQIILNLVSNALKFTPHGGRIEVATEYVAAGPLHLVVRDTGSGMTAEEIAAALDKRSDEAPRPTSSGGLGLGLPLVRALAEANGATISIEGRAGQGTRVSLAFASNRIVPV